MLMKNFTIRNKLIQPLGGEQQNKIETESRIL